MRTPFIFISLLFCTTVYSQKNNQVRTRLSNLLYIGVDNPVTIYKKTANCQVSIKNGTLTPVDTKSKDSATYTIKVDKSDAKPILTIKQGSETNMFTFRKYEIPNPQFTLRATGLYTPVTENLIEQNYFRKITGFTLDLKNFDFPVSMNAKSWALTIVKKDGQRIEQEGAVQNELLKITQEAHSGDIYIFHDIRIVVEGEERLMEDKVFRVK